MALARTAPAFQARPPFPSTSRRSGCHRSVVMLTSQVEAGSMLGAIAGNGLQIPLPYHQVRTPPHLELELVIGVEQHPITHLDAADVATDPVHLTPGQPLGHLCRRRDEDSTA